MLAILQAGLTIFAQLLAGALNVPVIAWLFGFIFLFGLSIFITQNLVRGGGDDED